MIVDARAVFVAGRSRRIGATLRKACRVASTALEAAFQLVRQGDSSLTLMMIQIVVVVVMSCGHIEAVPKGGGCSCRSHAQRIKGVGSFRRRWRWRTRFEGIIVVVVVDLRLIFIVAVIIATGQDGRPIGDYRRCSGCGICGCARTVDLVVVPGA